MNSQELFEQFNVSGQLRLPTETIQFGELPWNKHPEFDGVELKHIVRIAPNKAIGNHIHQTQLETHEVIAGSGTCVNNGTELAYEPGTITILPIGLPHEVKAGADGLYLFAKFIPALV